MLWNNEEVPVERSYVKIASYQCGGTRTLESTLRRSGLQSASINSMPMGPSRRSDRRGFLEDNDICGPRPFLTPGDW